MKRFLLAVVGNGDDDELAPAESLGCVALSGGLIASPRVSETLYSEQVLLMPKQTLWKHPTLRPLLLAFLPSSIAFLALEYGREQ